MAVKGIGLQATAAPASQLGVIREYILRKFVPMLEPETVYAQCAAPAMIPKGAGAFMAVWNIPQVRASESSTALSQLTASAGEITGTTITQVTCAMEDRGDWFKVGNLLAAANLQQTLDTYSEQLAQMGGEKIDTMVRDAGLGTTNFLHSGDATSAGVTLTSGDKLTIGDFAAIAGFFRSKNAKGFKKFGGDYFLGVVPEAEVSLVTEVTTARITWADSQKHVPAGFEKLVENHRFVGRYAGTTALRTTIVGTVSEDVTAYKMLALARYGVGNTGLGKDGPTKPTIIIKRPGNNDTYQPLNRYMTMGWLARLAIKMLDANRCLAVYSAV